MNSPTGKRDRMKWQDMKRRVRRYRDVPLLVRTIAASMKISSAPGHAMIHLADPRHRRQIEEREKITRYVNLCSFVRNKMGLRNSCLIHSIHLSRMLREHGLDARVHFGARRSEQGSMIGHCWVTVDEEEVPPDWQVIFSYPA
ncbi:lasso peptide biosynthesis B2 protein [Gemmatimonadota bacterium]